jgi:hypothetical protein
MAKIKVVYEWISPMGPLNNNSIPNVFDLAAGMDGVHIQNPRNATWPYIYTQVFSKFPQMFELSPAFNTKQTERFVYDFQIHYKQPFDSFFSYATPLGLFEGVRMSHHLFAGIRDHRGYLLLDVSLESFVSPAHFSRMHDYFTAHYIPLNKIIYLTGCPNGKELYDNYCNTANVAMSNRMHIVFWDAFEWQLSGRHHDDHYTVDRKIENINKTFLCFNFRYRRHRLDLLTIFHKHNLLNNSYFSMPSHNPDAPSQKFIDHLIFHDVNNIYGVSNEELQILQNNILPLVIDIEDGYKDHLKLTIENEKREMAHLYDSSLISVVTETNAWQAEISITEKIYKPILYKHPFIVVGSRGTLAELRKKGYKTFDKWFSEDYDNIEDYPSRMVAIGNLCKEIDDWSIEKKKRFLEESKEVTDHNYSQLQSVYGRYVPDFWKKMFLEEIK